MSDPALLQLLAQMKDQMVLQQQQLTQQQKDAAEQQRLAAEQKEQLMREVLAEKIAAEEKATAERLEADQRHRVEMQKMIEAINRNPVQQVEYRAQAPNNAEVRAEKLQRISLNIRKSNRLKPFKVSTDCDVKLFIKRFDEELVNMKNMAGLAGVLSDEEYIPIFRVCLEFAIVERIGQVLVSLGKTWENISKPDLMKLMRDEFGSKQTDVAEVLQMFGPKRLTKKPDEKVQEFYFKFQQNIPETMKPSDDDGRKLFVDLIHRAMFYIALEDEFLTKALADIKEPNPDLKKYFDEACAAEGRRKSHMDIAKSSTSVEHSGVTISKWDINRKKKGDHKSRKNPSGKNKSNDSTQGNGAKGGNNGQNGSKTNSTQKLSVTNTRVSDKSKLSCDHCQSKGHDVKTCWKLHPELNPFNKKTIRKVNAEDNDQDKDPALCFHSLETIYPAVKSFSSLKETHPLVTSEPLLTCLNVEGVMKVPVEIDSAASHNIISEFYFDKLQNHLKQNGKIPSKKLTETVKIRLADGSQCGQSCKVVQLHVSTDLSHYKNNFHKSKPKALTFLVVKGPNCLVGRHSIARLWPQEFERFKLATCANYKSLTPYELSYIKEKQIETKQINIIQPVDSIIVNPVTAEPKLQLNINSVKNSDKSGNAVSNADRLQSKSNASKLKPKSDTNVRILDKIPDIPIVDVKVKSNSSKSLAPVEKLAPKVSRSKKPAKAEPAPQPAPVACIPERTCSNQTDACDVTTWPDRRELPPLPDSPISQEMGIAYCKQICDVYHEVFNDEQGCFKGASAKITLKPGGLEEIKKSGPRPACKIPYGMEEQYYAKLKELYKNLIPMDGKDVITASQLVPVIEGKATDQSEDTNRVLKRLAINYKSTINAHLEDIPDVYTSCVDELAKVKGQYRTTVDMIGAFKQVPIEDDGLSQEIMAVATPWGYAKPTTLMFGVKTAPAIFNANMRKLLHACNGKGPLLCAQMVDDLCISGDSPREHFENLAELLYRFYACGLKVNKDKCSFYQDEVKFLGKIVDSQGVRLDPSTTDAILNMPEPIDKSQLRSFLGHISYISRHVPDLKSARAPLDKLVKPDVQFVWDKIHIDSFHKCKTLASNSALLTHFDPKLPLILTTDASPYGVGACLSHKVLINDKYRLKPIAYASASLKDSQKNYSQIDREGLGVFWGINHFRQYLLCKNFELHTDCSALVKIFGDKNDLNGAAAGRLSRWAAALMEYSFTVKHIRGTSNSTADSLSRLPVVDKDAISAPFPDAQNTSKFNLPESIQKLDSDIIIDCKYLAFYPSSVETSCTISQVVGDSTVAAWDLVPLTIAEVATATKECKIFGKLFRAIKIGLIDTKDKDLKPFQGVFESLYIENDVIHFGSRICIPPKYHDRLLTELHSTHIGVISMKKVIRNLVWWPGINRAIENIAAKCKGCKKHRKKPSANTLSVWPFARRPFERVHVDYFEYRGKHVLIMVDAFSKKLFLHYLGTDTTAPVTCAVLSAWFSQEYGSPTTLVSDNGPQFTSNYFADCMKKWNIKHIFSPPYHPQSNGLAERGVQLVKNRLKKMDVQPKAVDLYIALATISRVHGLTPHSSTDRCPFELIKLGNLPPLFPSLIKDVNKSSELTITRHCADRLRNRKTFEEGDKVTVYDNFTKLTYEAMVSEILGTNNYLVSCDNGFKHVSGDVMSHVARVLPDKLSPDATGATVQPNAADDTVDDELNDILGNDDNSSVISDASEDFDLPNANVHNKVRINRRGQRELNNLGPVHNLSRLRSGRR